MKKTISILIISVFLLSMIPILAQEEDIANQEDIELAGIIKPDSFLYGIELAFERIIELFSENAKLKHAQERLAEVRVMIQENKLEAAEKGRQRFEKLKLRIKNQTEIESEITLSENLGLKINEIISTGVQASETKMDEIKEMISNYRSRK